MIPCKLVHDTGTMLRFRTSQLGLLPHASRDVHLLLPTGRIVGAHFNRHPQNPNLSGRDLVRYIKRRLAFGAREDVLIEQLSTNLWTLHLLADAVEIGNAAQLPACTMRAGTLRPVDLSAILAMADREGERGRRVRTYRRVLRPAALRRLILGVVGATCMIEGCDACEFFDDEWGVGSGTMIVEVHHIEHVARTIDHHPRNLCVLCANHHRFVHGSGAWSIHHDDANVIFRRNGQEMTVVRPEQLFPAEA